MRRQCIAVAVKRTVWFLLVAIAVPTRIHAAPAAVHPPLVDIATAKCETCHAATIVQTSPHARDSKACLTCHQLKIADGVTTVVLVSDGVDLCVNCHEERAEQARGKLLAPHKPVREACTNCHNPHSSALPNLLKTAVPALCLGCHRAEKLNTTHARPVARANCLNCHDQHGSNFAFMIKSDKLHKPFADRSCPTCHRSGFGLTMTARPPELCYACHDKAKFARKVLHTAFSEGKCIGCHDPHVGKEAKLLRASGPRLCVSCHEAIARRMAMKTKHFPTEDGCLNCHDAHGSDYPAELNDKVPDLCLNCHDGTDEALRKKHLNADMKKIRCTICHDPHGSSEPHLWNSTVVHPPFAEQACEFCHDGDYKKLINEGTKELCYTCHTDIQELVTQSKVKHPAFEIAECTDCHTPHASLQQKLVKYPGGKVCTDCHNDKAPEEGEKAHGVINLLGCRACHEPHGGPRKNMLRIEGAALCLQCHVAANRKPIPEKDQVLLLGRFRVSTKQAARIPALPIANGRNHPVTNHRVSGAPTVEELSRVSVDFKGELSCFSCHNPHKGRYRLFVGGEKSVTEMCMRCHKR